MNAAELAAALGKTHREGREWRCLCPAHADHDPSLSITEKDGQLLVICRAGCDQKDVIAAIRARGLWPEPDDRDHNPHKNGHDTTPWWNRIAATYDYVNPTGKPFQVVRSANPKEFHQRQPDPTQPHGWRNNLDGITPVPYHLDELAAARVSANGTPWRVYITEGEKDADRIRSDWQLLATTNPGGAGKWRSDYNPYFSGADVVILPDNDDQGQKHANQVATALKPVATSVRILTLTGLPPKGDISDWIDQGGSQATLEELVDDLPLPTTTKPGPIHLGMTFADQLTAPDWLIQGIVQSGRLYACTSITGHGKTAVWLYCGSMIHAGRPIAANIETTHGNVLFLAGENPEDLRARMAGMRLAFNLSTLPLVFPHAFPMTEEETATLRQHIENLRVPLALIIGDTAASYFPGDDENSNVQAGQYGRTLRSLTQCPGNPAVVVLSHPTKNAARDNLLPRGGGAFLNELDGNLSLWSQEPGEATTLHWNGKIRGPDFDPIHFKLKPTKTGIADKKGRDLLTIIAQPIDDFEAHAQAEQAVANEDAVLQMLNDNPTWSWGDIARALNWFDDDGKPQRWLVQRALQTLQADKLVRNFRRKWTLTEAGLKSLKKDNDT